jgi:hypothetical protein
MATGFYVTCLVSLVRQFPILFCVLCVFAVYVHCIFRAVAKVAKKLIQPAPTMRADHSSNFAFAACFNADFHAKSRSRREELLIGFDAGQKYADLRLLSESFPPLRLL